jgi:hypothetical protein
MDRQSANLLRAALAALYPQAQGVEVSPNPDGALIVISGIGAAVNTEAGSGDIRVSIGNGDGPILRQLLTGHVLAVPS